MPFAREDGDRSHYEADLDEENLAQIRAILLKEPS